MSRIARELGRVFVLVLGWGLAFAAFVVVLSFVGCSETGKRSLAQKAARREACVWTDPLIVSISGQVLSVPATGRSTLTLVLGDPPLGDEPIDGPRVWPRRYAFCLDAPQTEPIEAIRFHTNDEALLKLDARFGFDTDHLLQIGILQDGSHPHGLPQKQPDGDPGRLTVFRSVKEGDHLSIAAASFDTDGFRPNGYCDRTDDDRRSCKLWIEDSELGLSYEFMSLWIADRDFDGAPVPEEFRDTARKLRALVRRMQADAVGRPGGPE